LKLVGREIMGLWVLHWAVELTFITLFAVGVYWAAKAYWDDEW
jgi:hypothetical protein